MPLVQYDQIPNFLHNILQQNAERIQNAQMLFDFIHTNFTDVTFHNTGTNHGDLRATRGQLHGSLFFSIDRNQIKLYLPQQNNIQYINVNLNATGDHVLSHTNWLDGMPESLTDLEKYIRLSYRHRGGINDVTTRLVTEDIKKNESL